SINKTKRKFDVNISKKRFYVHEEDRWVTLKVSSKGLKVIDKKGISEVLKASREKGYIK
ncbi:MAG: bL28 family ribosomal protein, partial [Flavobacteriaceae bacterium]